MRFKMILLMTTIFSSSNKAPLSAVIVRCTALSCFTLVIQSRTGGMVWVCWLIWMLLYWTMEDSSTEVDCIHWLIRSWGNSFCNVTAQGRFVRLFEVVYFKKNTRIVRGYILKCPDW